MIKDLIQSVLKSYPDVPDPIRIGYIKECLQSIVLREIYSHKETSGLLFYGGTSLRFLFGLNRLSEDLDFIGRGFSDFDGLGQILTEVFEKEGYTVTYKVQKFRIMLRFSGFLVPYGIKFGDSTDLVLKIEISDHFGFCKQYEEKLYPVLKHNQSILVRSLDQSTLFSTKLSAVLHREWSRTDGIIPLSVKGRDIYDLFWYLSQGVRPNIDCIEGVHDMSDLKNRLTKKIESISFTEVVQDIENFIEDRHLLDFFKTNGKQYILDQIARL